MWDAAAEAAAAAVEAAEAGIRPSVPNKKKAKECQKVNKMSTFILLFPRFTIMYYKVVPENISYELFLR
jgi:hypothetical protein